MKIRRWWLVRLVWLWTSVVAPWAGLAQVEGAQPSTSVTDALHNMADRAGVIFVGTVSDIRRVDGGGSSSGAVEVTFSVEQATRGCETGTTYTLREWAGLWMSNDQRYRVGQRLLMLLHAPGPGGLSAPVDGLDGAIPVRGTGTAIGPHSTTSASAPTAIADLRWIGAGGVIRPLTYTTVATGSVSPVHASPIRGVARVQGVAPATSAGEDENQKQLAVGQLAGTSRQLVLHVSRAPKAATEASQVVPDTQQPVSTLLQQIAAWGVNHAR